MMNLTPIMYHNGDWWQQYTYTNPSQQCYSESYMKVTLWKIIHILWSPLNPSIQLHRPCKIVSNSRQIKTKKLSLCFALHDLNYAKTHSHKYWGTETVTAQKLRQSTQIRCDSYCNYKKSLVEACTVETILLLYATPAVYNLLCPSCARSISRVSSWISTRSFRLSCFSFSTSSACNYTDCSQWKLHMIIYI